MVLLMPHWYSKSLNMLRNLVRLRKETIMPRFWFIIVIGFLMVGPEVSQAKTRPVIVELFTSQGCSSCPPADALIVELARHHSSILALTFHVTYWNDLGWRDPFSFPGATARQRYYVGLSISPEAYTPAMVVDGQLDVVGSNGPSVEAALAQAAAKTSTMAPIDVVQSGNELAITIGAGSGRGSVLVIGFDAEHQTHVSQGENDGQTLIEANVVRSLTNIGLWTGTTLSLRVAVKAGEEAAVLVQADDGHILAADTIRLCPSTPLAAPAP